MSALYLSAAHKSSGKTTLSIGICAALKQRGLRVQPFKKGPDYIDPIWLGMAAGKPCYSLDFYIAGRDATINDYAQRAQHADISIIEGNKGLHDGLDLDGSNSNAALAKAIETPVILVIDARGTMRGIAPLLIGYQQFDREVRIAGVIANMTGGARHETKLREAVEYYTDIPFLGAVAQSGDIELSERHLGLIPANEDPESRSRINAIRQSVEQHIELDRLIQIAKTSPQRVYTAASKPAAQFSGLKIAIARDHAFSFYYPADLEKFDELGAELIAFDCLRDPRLPEVDGLFIGGGFPERHGAALAANAPLRSQIRTAIENGLPTYAECGGLMYLSKAIHWQQKHYDMVGVLPGICHQHERPQGRGYVHLDEIRAQHPWSATPTASIRAHEFHYSSLEGMPEQQTYAYTVTRGNGIRHLHDGLLVHNLMASYAHQRDTIDNPWVSRFLDYVARMKSLQNPATPMQIVK